MNRHLEAASFGQLDGEFIRSPQFMAVKDAAYDHVLSRIESLGNEFSKWSRDDIGRYVFVEVDAYVHKHRVPINEHEMIQITEAITRELSGLGPLEDLLNDGAVEDILINGHKDIYVSRRGQLMREPVHFSDNEHVLRIVRRILAPLGRRLDQSSPMVDARMPDGGRLNAVIEPLAVDGPMVSIRKFRKDPLTLAQMEALGTFNAAIHALLQEIVRARCNILVSGGTSSGKTSLLNALARYIAPGERVVTVEDTAELSLDHPHVVRMETRQGGFDGSGAVNMRDLVRNSLRMRPDRIIVGEVRGAEVLEMMQAMNTGHDGSMGTIHASSARECLHRLEMLAGFAGFQGSELSLRRQITGAIDFVIQIARLADGRRRIVSITEITGLSDNVISTQELYRHASCEENGGDRDDWIAPGFNPHSPKLRALQPAIVAPPRSDVGGFDGW